MVAFEEYEDYSEMEEYEDNCEMELDVEEGTSESEEYDEIEEDEIEYLTVGDPIEVMPYLFPSSTDYLVRKKGDGGEERVYADCLKGKKYVLVITFCIPLDIGDSDLSAYDLQDVFPELLAEGRHDFEVVLVARMNPDFPNCDDKHLAQEEFDQFFAEFPVSFLAIPIWDIDRINNVFQIMGQDSADCIVVDLERGQVSHTDLDCYSKYGADFYPFTDKREQELEQEAGMICSGRMPLATLLRSQSSDVLDCVVHHGGSGSSCGKRKSLSSLANKLVGLYVLHDGYDMDKVLNLYKLCKCNNLEFEIVVVCEKRGGEPAMSVSSWKDYAHSLLQNKDCCGWLRLPFDDRVCRRLNLLCELNGGDKLIIVGPNASYIDPHGMEVFREYGFGVEYYPFTKQAIWDSHVARLRGLRLEELFTTVGINDLICPDGQSVPVSSVRDTDTLLCFGFAPGIDKPCWEGHLLEWFNEIMKSAGDTRCQMIYVCLCCRSKESWDCCDSTGKPWMSVAHRKVNNKNLFDLLFDRLSGSMDSLVAFGSDGRLRTLTLQNTLLDQCGPATFPESDDNLRMEVGQLLQYSPLDHWHELLDTDCDD